LKRTSASTAASAPDYLPRTRLRREVRSARYDAGRARWLVDAVDLATGRAERYAARHLVAAAGENNERVVPGMDTFPGKVVHSADYGSAGAFKGKFVLVVGPSACQRLPVRSTSAAASRTPTAVRALCL
jgi:cation diffusion facilitator CzcD-associated flavoprotein CzcO